MSIVQGSIASNMMKNNLTMAEAWLDVSVVVLMDVSGSMAVRDQVGDVTRFTVANQELSKVQEENPGRVAIIEFSTDVKFVPFGELSQPDGSTNVADALKFAQMMDKIGDIQFLLVSDGEPNDERAAMDVARTFKHKINTIFVGKEGGSGQRFLEDLSRATGGTFSRKSIKQLSGSIAGYLY